MANITKRGNTYRIRVSCGCDVEGKQIIHSKTWVPSSGMTEKQIDKEVKRQAVLFEEECKNGLVSNNPNLTFAEFVPRYLSIKKDILAVSTLETYEQAFQRLIIPKIGHLKLNKIKPIHIQNFINELSETHCINKQKNGKVQTSDKTLSASSIKRYLAMIQSVFNQAVKLDLIPNNPAKAEKLTLPKSVTPKIEIFSKQEAAAMLQKLEHEPLQYQVLIQLAIMTGARRGELVALKFTDIDLINNRITIERAAVKLKGQPITIKPPKDYEVRTITINESCISLIRDLKKEKEKERLRLGSKWEGDDWLFTQWNGAIMHPTTITKWFSDFLKKNNFEHRKFHSLRHTSATLLIYGGVNLKHVQGRLGHKEIGTTNKYLHYLSEIDNESAYVLQNMLLLDSESENSKKSG